MVERYPVLANLLYQNASPLTKWSFIKGGDTMIMVFSKFKDSTRRRGSLPRTEVVKSLVGREEIEAKRTYKKKPGLLAMNVVSTR